MNDYGAQLRLGFFRAWENLCDWPLPASVERGRTELEKNVDEESQGFHTLLFFPLLGAAFGLVLLWAGRFAGLLLAPVPTALLFGVGAGVFLEFRDRGRGLAGEVAFLRSLCNPATHDELSGALDSTLLTLLLLAKMAALALLFYHGSGGMAGAALIVNFSVQGELASYGDASASGRGLIHTGAGELRALRLLALLLLFFAAISNLAAFLALALCGALWCLGYERRALRSGALTPGAVSAAGAGAETWALLLAALLVLSF